MATAGGSTSHDESQGSHDDKWDPNVRRRLRQKLREELNDTHRNRDDITIPEELLKRLKKGDSLYEQVVSTREAVLDSENFKTLSEIACHQSENARGELIKFDPILFREKLITYMGGRSRDTLSLQNLDWHVLGERALKAFKSTPCVNFNYGALETVPLKQTVRLAGTRKKTIASSIEKPKELEGFQEEEESTTKDVSYLLSKLKKVCREKGGMNYYQFLIDPSSFSHTIENIFHFSFLVKEGRAGVKVGDDGYPFVFLPENVDKAGQSQKSSKNQVIVSLDMNRWQDLIEKLQITEAFIPQRDTSSK